MPLSPDLIAALRTPPQDHERFLVVADRLQTEGDPRGELIMLQAQRLEQGDTDARRAAEAAYIQKHDRALLGKLWKAPSAFTFDWELGFIRTATVSTQDLPRRQKLSKLVGELLELESSALLESLRFALPRPEGTETQLLLDTLVVVARTAPPTLALLQIRELRPNDYDDGYPQDGYHWPTFAPPNAATLTWRGRPLRVETDEFPIDAVADLLGAWEEI